MTSGDKIKFQYWPFEKNDTILLLRISKPYLGENNRWLIKGLFSSTKQKHTKELIFNISDLIFLHMGGLYNQEGFIGYQSTQEIEISLQETQSVQLHTNESTKSPIFNYDTFGFTYNSNFVVIPLIEIVRAVLAADVFWLHRLTQLDALDTLFTYQNNQNTLTIDCSPSIPISYIESNPKIYHLAWILTNPEIYRMITALHNNIIRGKGFLFDFEFSSFHTTAKAEKLDNSLLVREITIFKNKKINAQAIEITHPKLKKRILTKDIEEKPSINIKINKDNDKHYLDNAKTGFHSEPDPVNYSHTPQFEYENNMDITRHRQEEQSPKYVVTEETEKKYIVNDNIITTSESGGLERAAQVEVSNPSIPANLFQDIDEIIQFLEQQNEVLATHKRIEPLNQYIKKFSKLKDKKSLRYYCRVNIILRNGKEALLIEIEREEYSISTLLVVSDKHVNWEEIYCEILKNTAYSWPTDILEKLETSPELAVHRHSHNANDIKIKANKIFSDIVS